MTTTPTMAEDLKHETNWDKVFSQSEKVDHKKVTFKKRDMILPSFTRHFCGFGFGI